MRAGGYRARRLDIKSGEIKEADYILPSNVSKKMKFLDIKLLHSNDTYAARDLNKRNYTNHTFNFQCP